MTLTAFPTDLLDATCYFITKSSLDTLFQLTTNHISLDGTSRFSPPEPVASVPFRPSLPAGHFFSGVIVSSHPPLVLASGGAAMALESSWKNYYVLLDDANVVPNGQIPSMFCTINRIHRICKNYPLPSFGSLHWIVLELSQPRSHTPLMTRTQRIIQPGIPTFQRTRRRSQSFRETPSPTEVSVQSGDPSIFAPETVFFDLAQSYTPLTSPATNGSPNNKASDFFRQAPQRLILSIISLRTRALFTPIQHSATITVDLIFDSIDHAQSPHWSVNSGLMMVLDNGKISHADPWLIGTRGQQTFTTDVAYRFTLSTGLAEEGVFDCIPATFHTLRLVRQSTGHGAGGTWSGFDVATVRPRAIISVSDVKDSSLVLTLGPIVFNPERVDGAEWRGTIPPLMQC